MQSKTSLPVQSPAGTYLPKQGFSSMVGVERIDEGPRKLNPVMWGKIPHLEGIILICDDPNCKEMFCDTESACYFTIVGSDGDLIQIPKERIAFSMGHYTSTPPKQKYLDKIPEKVSNTNIKKQLKDQYIMRYTDPVPTDMKKEVKFNKQATDYINEYPIRNRMKELFDITDNEKKNRK